MATDRGAVLVVRCVAGDNRGTATSVHLTKCRFEPVPEFDHALHPIAEMATPSSPRRTTSVPTTSPRSRTHRYGTDAGSGGAHSPRGPGDGARRRLLLRDRGRPRDLAGRERRHRVVVAGGSAGVQDAAANL